jgi:hypothetical protein
VSIFRGWPFGISFKVILSDRSSLQSMVYSPFGQFGSSPSLKAKQNSLALEKFFFSMVHSISNFSSLPCKTNGQNFDGWPAKP